MFYNIYIIYDLYCQQQKHQNDLVYTIKYDDDDDADENNDGDDYI